MVVKQLQDIYSFRKTGLTCHKWKADTTKLKGIGEADDPDEGVGETDDLTEADDSDEGVGEADDPDEGVGEANDVVGKVDDPNEVDDPDEGVGEADDPDVAMLGLHICIYKEISCAPRLVLIKKTPTRKGFRKICS